MRLIFSTFAGTKPAIAPRFLPPGQAVRAVNCDFSRKRLDPLPGLGAQTVLPQAGELLSLYPITPDVWLAWPGVVDVVRLSVSGGNGRIAYAGQTIGYPKQTDIPLALAGPPAEMPNGWRRCGVLPPTTPLTVDIDGVAGPEFMATASYAYTMVTAWGEESRPGPITGVFSVNEGQYTRETGFAHDAASGNDYTHYRLYRLDASDASAEYLWLSDIAIDLVAIDTEEFIDPFLTPAGPETLPTQGWLPLPDETTGLMQYHDITVSWNDQELRLSPLRVPYAYKKGVGVHTFPETLKGIGYFAETLVVVTSSGEHRLHGKNPSYMTREDVAYSRGCVSRRSLVSSPAGVFYAAADGLVLAGDAGSPLVTTSILPEQWRALAPQTLIGFFWRGGYLGFFTGSGRGILFDVESAELIEIELPSGTTVTGGYYNKDTDTIHLLLHVDGVGYRVAAWADDHEQPLTALWQSPPQRLSPDTAFSLAKVEGDFSAGRTAQLTFTVDAVDVYTITVTSEEPFRLPLAAVGAEWQITSSGTAAVDRVWLVDSIEELDR